MSDPPTAFDMDLDAPLTQEEEIVLSQIEAQHTVVSHGLTIESPTNSPRKKRKRRTSASPNASPSPYKLRGSVRFTERALKAGYKPNTSHIFRQDPSGDAPLSGKFSRSMTFFALMPSYMIEQTSTTNLHANILPDLGVSQNPGERSKGCLVFVLP